MIEAVLLDCDYTVWDRHTGEVYLSAKERLQRLPVRIGKAFCTNQAGVGFRFWAKRDGWGDPKKFKGERAIRNQYERLVQEGLGLSGARIYYAFRAKSKNGNWGPPEKDTPEWSKEWRKPEAGMLLQALADLGVPPENAVYIGDDRDEDKPDSSAAKAAGVEFLRAPSAWDDIEFWKSFEFKQTAFFDMAAAGKRESDLSNMIDSPRKLSTAQALSNLAGVLDRLETMPEPRTYGGREGAMLAARSAIEESVRLHPAVPETVKKKRGKRK